MDEGVLWWLGDRLARRVLAVGLGALIVIMVFLFKPEWPAVVAQWRADYVAERLQAAVDRLIDDPAKPEPRQVPSAPGKLTELRQDMRGSS